MPLNALRRAIEQNALVTDRIYAAYRDKNDQALRELIHELDLVCADLAVALEEIEAMPPFVNSVENSDEEGVKRTTPKP